jgi:hypothetical protein
MQKGANVIQQAEQVLTFSSAQRSLSLLVKNWQTKLLTNNRYCGSDVLYSTKNIIVGWYFLFGQKGVLL